MKKTVLITGGTGGIGGAFAKEFSRRGYRLLLPVRDLNSPSAKELSLLEGAALSLCLIDDRHAVDVYLAALKEQGESISVFVLAAGVFKRDDKFEGATKEAQQQRAISELEKANVTTKITVIEALHRHYASDEKNMTGIIIGSHAANFGHDHSFRPEQEGYVSSMRKVQTLAQMLKNQGRFKTLVLKEPGKIDTPSLREELGLTGDEQDMRSPEEFVVEVLHEAGL